MSECRWSSKRKINRTCHEHSRSKHLKQSDFQCFTALDKCEDSIDHIFLDKYCDLFQMYVISPIFPSILFRSDFDWKLHIPSPTEHHKVSFFLLECEIAPPPCRPQSSFWERFKIVLLYEEFWYKEMECTGASLWLVSTPFLLECSLIKTRDSF